MTTNIREIKEFLTPEQYKALRDLPRLDKLEEAQPDYMYRTIFIGKGVGKGYDFLAECFAVYPEDQHSNASIHFRPLQVIQKGDVDNKDLNTEWAINDLDYIVIFRIGKTEDFPEYLL